MERRLLFPVDLRSFAPGKQRLPPLHNLAPAILLEKLIADHVFGLLTDAAIEALARENAARFAAMDSAHENVSRKLKNYARTRGRHAKTRSRRSCSTS
jgi:F-type H+-transporting ATPase subunit gamma